MELRWVQLAPSEQRTVYYVQKIMVQLTVPILWQQQAVTAVFQLYQQYDILANVKAMTIYLDKALSELAV